jgi:sugar phosphate isomerase/epimerase
MDKALAHAEASGDDRAGLLLDSMHVFATGTSLEAVAALPRNRVVHAQLCDTFAASEVPYFERAKFERLAPGEGDLSLADFLRALAGDVALGLEIPQRAKALAGADHRERIATILEATHRFTTDLL